MTGSHTMCIACLRLKRDSLDLTNPTPGGGTTCSAFPDGIPTEIMDEGYDHRQPFPGDDGKMFVLDPEFEDVLQKYEARKAAPTG